MHDDALMTEAIAEGERGRLASPPNPWVGCVIVADGAIVGRGHHQGPGTPHAEQAALAAAGRRAHGATVYVTLEPCPHEHRDPCCADALIRSGVTRVVVATTDPDRRVEGRGIARLRSAGIDVEVGPGGEAARASLAPYLHQRRRGRSYAVLKTAVSLDGRTAAADGTSRWITGEPARADAHRLRAESQAVMVGAGTALTDRPALTVRRAEPAPSGPPVRVLVDGRGRVPATGPLFDVGLAPTLVVTTEAADPEITKSWQATGAELAIVPPGPAGAGVDLDAALAVLSQRGVLQVLVEGGATLHGAFVAAGLVSRLVIYMGGRLLGAAGHPVLAWPGAATIAAAPTWKITSVRDLGGDARIDAVPAGEGGG